jgi:hypothetical protein
MGGGTSALAFRRGLRPPPPPFKHFVSENPKKTSTLLRLDSAPCPGVNALSNCGYG